MQLHLGGHLNWYDPEKRAWLEIPLREPVPLRALLERLGIPRAEIAVATINREGVSSDDAPVTDADRVELFPPVGGGSTN